MILQGRICALSLLMLSGCYAHYPSTWKPLETGQQDCSSISGVYHARASGGSRYGRVDLVPRVLQDEKIRLGAERVELRVEDGVLAVAVFSADRQLHARQFLADKGEYSCDGGKIRMSHVVVDGFGARRNRVVLSKTVDGALVVEDAGEVLGFFVLPIAASVYYRFESYVSGQ